MKNTGGRHGGSITAAQFLQRFVNGTPWAHLDIAGTGMNSPAQRHQSELGLGLRRAAARPACRRSLRGLTAIRAPAMEIWFYHLQQQPLERALPALLEASLAHGWRVVVQAASEERLDALDEALWTYADAGFLAHGRARDGDAELQPVYLTTQARIRTARSCASSSIPPMSAARSVPRHRPMSASSSCSTATTSINWTPRGPNGSASRSRASA